MRLNQNQIKTITTLAKKHFSDDVQVYLFGSSTDDRKRGGGDIDLLIRTPDESDLSTIRKLSYLAELKKVMGDRKIDVVIDNAHMRSKQNFYRSITRNYILITDK